MTVVEAGATDRRVVVFDLGGVLIDWNPRYVYRELFDGDEEQVEWFLAHICTSEWNHRHDAGRSFDEGVRELVERHPEYADYIRAYRDRWEEMLGGPLEETVDLLRELKERGHPLFALTNWSAETFPRARSLYPFLQLFDGIVVSGEICMAKPDPEIFHHLLETHAFDAGEAVFIDDVRANVETARRLGFHAIHFQGAGPLRDELARLGFLNEPSR